MQAWAAVAIAQVALIALSLWRLSKVEDRPIRWSGVALFVVAALALLVLVRDDGYWAAIAIFGSVVLAADALLLRGALVAALCTTHARATADAEAPRPALKVVDAEEPSEHSEPSEKEAS